MTTKLTLTVEESIRKKAEFYAEQTGKSLSELVENYLATLSIETAERTKPLSPKLKRIAGAVKLPPDFNEKKELRAYFENKH